MRGVSFDHLRLFAAWLVIVAHSYELRELPELLHGFTGLDTFGGVGVVMFFAVSGYWVTRSRLGLDSVWKFLFHRALRIFPALWVLILLSTFVFGPALSRFSWFEVVSSPTTADYFRWLWLSQAHVLPGVFENNPLQPGFNGSLWTLPLEVKCYLAVAALGFVPHKWRGWWFCVVWLGYAWIAWMHFSHGVFRVNVFAVESYLFLKLIGAFLVGATVAVCKLERQCTPLPTVALVALLVIAAKSSTMTVDVLWLPFSGAIALVALSLGFAALREAGEVTRPHADYSYGLYLYAFPIQQALIAASPTISPFLLTVVATLITSVFAIASWHCVEKPFLSTKHHASLRGLRAAPDIRRRVQVLAVGLAIAVAMSVWKITRDRRPDASRLAHHAGLGYLDTPRAAFRSGNPVLVKGWVIHPEGVRRARIFHGDEPLTSVGLLGRRPDVAHVYPIPGARHSGFSVVLPASAAMRLPPDARLRLRIELHNGQVTSLPDWIVP